jgi:peptidoglycan/LPS O-acetylase OafA/YrhL
MRFSKKTLACSMIAIGGVSATVVAVAGFLTDGNLGVFGYLRVGALAIGVGLSLSENTIAKFFGKKFFGTIGSLVLATAILISFKTQFLGLAFSLGALATVFLITSIRHSESDQWLKHLMSQKQIVYIGQISYEIYLWHGVLREVMEVVFEGNGILTIIAAYGLTMILSAVTHKALAPLQRRMLSAWVLNK